MPASAVVRHVVTFARVLREAGLEVGPGRVADALRGLDAVELTRRDDVYWTLRSTLVSRREELETFDLAFQAWFLGAAVRPQLRLISGQVPPPGAPGLTPAPAAAQELDGGDREVGGYSADELLAHKDFGEMSHEEFERARKLIAAIATKRPRRRSRRLRATGKRGESLHLRGLVRASLATGGDPVHRAFRSRVLKPRKLLLILDVSGSMESYARALLLFLHAAQGSGRGVETFAFGTRLTRLTPDLASRDPETALALAARQVADWSGGTRIGFSLKAYNDGWGRRALTRGAVAVILSDGWEREDDALVGRETARLARQAFAVVWVNPLKGDPRYEPLAGGMRAALPHIDRFVTGHDVASLETLASLLGDIDRRHEA
ncbi:MAG: hypothetical protein JWR30_3846 [Conexibacter sp.]|nr:hypothetical protein [Conexibacter sp.]